MTISRILWITHLLLCATRGPLKCDKLWGENCDNQIYRSNEILVAIACRQRYTLRPRRHDINKWILGTFIKSFFYQKIEFFFILPNSVKKLYLIIRKKHKLFKIPSFKKLEHISQLPASRLRAKTARFGGPTPRCPPPKGDWIRPSLGMGGQIYARVADHRSASHE